MFQFSTQITPEVQVQCDSAFKKVKFMHHLIPSANIPPGNPQGFAPTFSPDPGLARESDLLSIIKVPSCQLMPNEGTFQLQTDLPSITALLL